MTGFRALRFHRLGDPVDVIRVEEVVGEPLADDEVLIRVSAFALNRADWMYCRGEHYSVPVFPARIGSECAGTVVAVGREVDPALVGRRVCTIPFHSERHGVQGEFATIPSRYLAPWPDGLDAAEAAALWLQYLTAYFGLAEVAGLAEGDTVLVAAASSSAGLAAIQVAKRLGARVIATSRTDAKVEAILAAGADHVIALDGGEGLAKAIGRLTNGGGVHVVFDPVAGPFISDYLDALARWARIVIYGALSGRPTELDLVRLVRPGAAMHFFSLFNHVGNPEGLRRGMDFVAKAVAEGLRPRIDSEHDFEHVIDAYRRLDSQSQIGKIIVRVGGDASDGGA